MVVQTGRKENVTKKVLVPDPDPNFHLKADADPDPATHQCDVNLRPLVYKPSMAPFLSLHLHCECLWPPGLHFERPKLLNIDFNADPDPDFSL